MKRISIIGVGLIGGSLGLALKKRAGARGRWRIIGAGRNKEKLRLAMRRGAIDAFTLDFSKAAMESDIVIICAPVEEISRIVKKIIKSARPGAIIMDAGSVKLPVVMESEKVIKASGRKDIFFVGAHPLAGSEKTGVENADEDLYKEAAVVLTPIKGLTNPAALSAACALWRAAGAKIEIMSPEKHDNIVASTSHLPHILSAALVSAVYSKNKKTAQTAKLLAGSFSGFTRISDSDPSNWAGICKLNSRFILEAVEEYIDELKRMRVLLRGGQSGKNAGLIKYFERIKKERWQLLKLRRGKI